MQIKYILLLLHANINLKKDSFEANSSVQYIAIIFNVLTNLAAKVIKLILSTSFSAFFFTKHTTFLHEKALFLEIYPIMLLIDLMIKENNTHIIEVIGDAREL